MKKKYRIVSFQGKSEQEKAVWKVHNSHENNMGVTLFPSQLSSVWLTHVAARYISGPPSKGTLNMFYKIIQMFLRVWTLTLAQQQRVQQRMRGVPVVLCSACWRTHWEVTKVSGLYFLWNTNLDFSFWNHI